MVKRKKLNKSERQQIYDMFDGHCAYCGYEIDFKDMQVDHIEPLELGGADEIDNMFPSCRSCNHYKHTLTIEKFRQQLENMPKVLMRNSVTFKNALRYGLVALEFSNVKFYYEKISESKERHNPDYPPEHCFTVRECEECGELYEPFCEFKHICKLQNSYSKI